MEEYKREAMKKLIYKKGSFIEFIKKFGFDPNTHSKDMFILIEEACSEKNYHDVELLMGVCDKFKLLNLNHIQEITKLLKNPNHHMHEELAFLLEELKSPKSILALYETALTKFDYLEYDNSEALARKCIWALGEIGTDDAFEKLKLLANSKEEYISDTARKQLERRGIL